MSINKSSISGIVFDKDGTLIPFTKTWLPAYQQATKLIEQWHAQPGFARFLLHQGGYDTKHRRWQADSLLASGATDDVLLSWQQALGRQFSLDEHQQLNDIFEKAVESIEPAVGDLANLMRQLKGLGLHLGLATMDSEESARSLLHKLDVQQYFDFSCGYDSGFGKKPDPGMLLAFSQHTSIPLSRIVMVGDSPRDLIMANQAGCRAIGVLTGSSDYTDLSPLADTVLNDIGELPTYLTQ